MSNPPTPLNRETAVLKLMACHSLAARLTQEGGDLVLSPAEEECLIGFKQVWLEGWLGENNHIHRQAGLSRSEIVALQNLLQRWQHHKLQHLHQSGEES